MPKDRILLFNDFKTHMYIEQNERERLFKGLGLFLDAFRLYVVDTLKNSGSSDWTEEFVNSLTEIQKQNWTREFENEKTAELLIDFHHLSLFARKNKQLLFADFGKKVHDLPTWLNEIAGVRHKVAHFGQINTDEAAKTWINMRTIAKILNNPELVNKLSYLEKQIDLEVSKNNVKTHHSQNKNIAKKLDVAGDGRQYVETELKNMRADFDEVKVGRRKLLKVKLSNGRNIKIWVKTKRGNGNWHSDLKFAEPISQLPDPKSETEFWIFINLNDYKSNPTCWIVPDSWLKNDIWITHQKYLEKRDGNRAKNNDSTHHSIDEKRIDIWQERWELLD